MVLLNRKLHRDVVSYRSSRRSHCDDVGAGSRSGLTVARASSIPIALETASAAANVREDRNQDGSQHQFPSALPPYFGAQK